MKMRSLLIRPEEFENFLHNGTLKCLVKYFKFLDTCLPFVKEISIINTYIPDEAVSSEIMGHNKDIQIYLATLYIVYTMFSACFD